MSNVLRMITRLQTEAGKDLISDQVDYEKIASPNRNK